MPSKISIGKRKKTQHDISEEGQREGGEAAMEGGRGGEEPAQTEYQEQEGQGWHGFSWLNECQEMRLGMCECQRRHFGSIGYWVRTTLKDDVDKSEV
jgi:hypothetical protein